VGWAPAERLGGTYLLLYTYAFASDKSRRICRSPDAAADRPPPSREHAKDMARQTRGVSLNPVLCALVNCHQNQFGDGGMKTLRNQGEARAETQSELHDRRLEVEARRAG
jgi:hypothetical protein